MQVKWNNRKNPDRTKGERRKGGTKARNAGYLQMDQRKMVKLDMAG